MQEVPWCGVADGLSKFEHELFLFFSWTCSGAWDDFFDTADVQIQHFDTLKQSLTMKIRRALCFSFSAETDCRPTEQLQSRNLHHDTTSFAYSSFGMLLLFASRAGLEYELPATRALFSSPGFLISCFSGTLCFVSTHGIIMIHNSTRRPVTMTKFGHLRFALGHD